MADDPQGHGADDDIWVLLVETADPRDVHIPRSRRQRRGELYVFGPYHSERAAHAARKGLPTPATVKRVLDLDYRPP